MPQVFISYVRDDSLSVQKLAQTLELYRIKVWLDRNSLKPGYRWKKAIRDGIGEGDFFIACFSRAYSGRVKTYMNEELTLAIDELRQRPTEKAWFIPILLDDCEIPDRDIGGGESLRSIQSVSLHLDWTKGVRDLLAVIQPDSARLYELTQLLQSSSARTRIKAADDLGSLDELAIDAVPLLTKTLEDENETVRAAAADALRKIGTSTKDVITKLKIVAADRNDFYAAKHATAALNALKEKGAQSLINHESAEASEDGTPVRALLKELNNGNLAVIHELGRLGTHAASAVPALCEINTRESTEALGHIGAISAVPTLVCRLRKGDYWGRYQAARALEEIADASAIPALVEALRGNEDSIASAASDALLAIGTSEAVGAMMPTLLEQLTYRPSAGSDIHVVNNTIHLRANSARVLGCIGRADFVPLLVPLLSDTWSVWKEAAIALLQIGTSEALAAVSEVAVGKGNSGDDFERTTCAMLLGRIGDPAHIQLLTKMLDDKHFAVRDRAQESLRLIRSTGQRTT